MPRTSSGMPPTTIGRVAIALAAALLIAATFIIGQSLKDPTPRFLERRSHLASVDQGPIEIMDGHEIRPVRLTAASGLEVELLLKQPIPADTHGLGSIVPKRPLVVLLGGHNTGKKAVELIPETHGAVVAALSYPFKGDHRVKGLQVIREVPAIRNALLDAPPAVMLAMDYLLSLPGIDSSRTEAVGISLGAPFVVIAGALDPRITRVWSIHGSGGSYGAIETNLRRAIPWTPARAPVAGVAALLVSGPRMAPERWAGRIAPRPFVMLNARDDAQMPLPLVERLYASAGEPKSMIWVPGGHVRPRPEVVRPLIDTVLARVFAAAPVSDSLAVTLTPAFGQLGSN